MPDRIKEIRVRFATSMTTSFDDASSSDWAADDADVYVLAATDWDISGAVEAAIESAVKQRRLGGKPPGIPGPQSGSIKLSMQAGKGSADTTPPFMATLMSKFLGGLTSPGTAKTDACEAGCTSTVINATAHGVEAGTAVLINNEVRRIASKTADTFTLEMALSAAPSESDAIVYSHTVYHDQTATQSYLNILAIGYHAEDQWQALGCMGGFAISGLGLGEVPSIDFELKFGQFQLVPAGERDQLEPSEALSGDHGPAGKEAGGFFLGDWGVTTRAMPDGGDYAISPNLSHEMIPNKGYANGCGGWRTVGFEPSFEATLLTDYDKAGLEADYQAKTAKQILWQFGSTAQHCMAVTMPRATLDARPAPAAINNLAGQKIVGHAQEPTVAATADNLYSAAMAIHWF